MGGLFGVVARDDCAKEVEGREVQIRLVNWPNLAE
jgi:hypothetical protein